MNFTLAFLKLQGERGKKGRKKTSPGEKEKKEWK